MQIRNLDAILGAEILGIELAAPLVKAEIDAIETAWRERLVVVFHAQSLSDPQLMAFSRNFGELDPPGPNPYGEPFNKSHPEVNVISNVVENGKPIGSLGDGEAVWHADMTYVDVPPKAAVLHALEVPPPEAGGNTYFANMFAAYETLPEHLKKAAEGKVAVHDGSRNSAGHLRKGYKEVTDVRETVGAHHPLIRTDPGSGRKALFLGRRPNAYVLGLDLAESEALLDALWSHATQPRFAMCHHWQIGDVLMWNKARPLRSEDATRHASQPDSWPRACRLMRLEAITLRTVRLPLIRPYVLSYRTFTEFEPIIVEVRDGDGRIGWGEGHISPGSSSETREGGWAFCREHAAAVVGKDTKQAKAMIAANLAASKVAATALLTAIEMLENHPLLHIDREVRLPLLTPFSSHAPKDIEEEVERRLVEGFRTFKIKVGKDADDDAKRVTAAQRAIAGRAPLSVRP